jgi:hypothetical protein
LADTPTAQPGIHIDVKIGTTHQKVALAPTAAGPQAGFMDLNGVATQLTDVTVTNASGRVVPCQQ